VKKMWKTVDLPQTDSPTTGKILSLLLRLGKGAQSQKRPYSLSQSPVLFSLGPAIRFQTQGAAAMEWTTPQHEEIDLNCEVSSYANAEL